MSGIYTGVQSRLKEIAPNAFYVHCAAHNLNLVVNFFTTTRNTHFMASVLIAGNC